MDAYLLLLAKALVSTALSLAVLRALALPLVNVLARICPDDQAAAFWLSYTRVMLLIAPLLLVLTVDMATAFANPLDSLRLAFMAALAGLLIGLQAIGRRLGRFVAVPRQPGSRP